MTSGKSVKSHYQYLVIGAGPAGLQMGYWLEKAGEDYLIFERNDHAGSFFSKFPINRKLISINKKHFDYDPGTDPAEVSLRYDWNSLLSDNPELRMTNFSDDYFPNADDLVRYLNVYASANKLKISYNTNVSKIAQIRETGESSLGSSTPKKNFRMTIEKGESEPSCVTCEYLIVATGVTKPFIPAMRGIEHALGYEDFDTQNLDKYNGKRVGIIGAGNSAMEVADSLMNRTKYMAISTQTQVKWAWQTHFVANIRAVNSNFLDSFQLKAGNYMTNSYNTKILKLSDNLYHITELGGPYHFDHVIRCTGFKFDKGVFDTDEQEEINLFRDKFPEITWELESKQFKNLFFLGTITQSLDFKRGNMALIHGFRSSAKFVYDLTRMRSGLGELVPLELGWDLQELANFITREFSENACLWQGFLYWCTVIEIDRERERFLVYRNLPIGWVKEFGYFGKREILLLDHEYGFEPDDNAFEIFTAGRSFTGVISKFIHPIIRYYPGNDFSLPEYVQCECGEWDEHDWMFRYTFCHQCFNSAYCVKCRTKVKLSNLDCRQHYKKYQPGPVAPTQVEEIQPDRCYTLHLFEDLLGRYHSYHNLQREQVHQRETNIVTFRYLDYLLNRNVYDVWEKTFQLTVRNANFTECTYFYFSYVLSTSVIKIDPANRLAIVNISQKDQDILETNPKKVRYYEFLLENLKKRTGIQEIKKNILKGKINTLS